MYQIGNVIASVIQARHPGGLQGFRDAGGIVNILKGEPFQVWLYYPNMKEFPIDVKNILQGICDRAQMSLRFTEMKMEISEEDYMDTANKLIEVFSQHNINAVAMRITDLCVTVTPMITVSLSEFEKAVAVINEKVPEVTRIVLMRGNGKLSIYETQPRTPPEQTVYLEDLPARQTAISEDDILNLKIALGTINSVEDFINSL